MAVEYKDAVILVERCEGNASVGNQWIESHVLSLDLTLREVLTAIFGEAPDPSAKKYRREWFPDQSTGRVLLTVPRYHDEMFDDQ